MNASEAIFRLLLAVMLTLAIVLLVMFPHQEPGSGSRVISILALAVQAFLIAVAVAGIYFGWEPFDFLDEE